jgi:hypothetical protein
MLRRDLQLDQQQFARQMIAAGHVLDRHHIDQLQQLGVDLRDDRRPIPVVTRVTRDTVGSLVGATDSDSML